MNNVAAPPQQSCTPTTLRRPVIRFARVGLGCCLALCLWLAGVRQTQAQTPLPLTPAASTDEAEFTTSLAWGDFDNDGDLDLMTGNGMVTKDDLLATLDEVALLRMLPVARQAIVERITNLNISNERQSRLYCNEGGVLVSCWVTPQIYDDFTVSVAWGDADQDGDLDLAVGNTALGLAIDLGLGPLPLVAPTAINRIYRNNGLDAAGNPQFEMAWASTEGDSTLGVAWGDYDGDQRLDLAVANSKHYMTFSVSNLNSPGYYNEGQASRIYRNITPLYSVTTTVPASLTFVLDETFQPAAAKSFRATWVDVDGDQQVDLAFANQGSSHVYCNRRQGNAAPRLELCWSSPDAGALSVGMDWGDVNGDHKPDLALGNAELWDGAHPSRVYLNGGLGADQRLRMTEIWDSSRHPEDSTLSMTWGDANKDGHLDLALGNGNFGSSQPVRIYCGDGATLSREPCWSSSQSDTTTSIAWGDVDSDGDLDLAVGNISVPLGQKNRLYRNDALVLTPTFTVLSAPESNFTRSIAWGDVDGDGDLDLAVGNDNDDDPNQLYQNNESVLTLIQAPGFSDQPGTTQSLAWGDADGDGDLDLAVGHSRSDNLKRLQQSDSSLTIYCNTGLTPARIPTFTVGWTFTATIEIASVAWGDMDGDGDLDLAAGVSERTLDLPGGAPSWLFRNTTSNSACQMQFVPVKLAERADATQSVAWGDMDGDGDLDLAVGNSVTPNRVYRNESPDNQTTRFTLAWTAPITEVTSSVAWGDIDGDGDLDLAVGNVAQSKRIYCNEGALLAQRSCWQSQESARTRSIALGDVDNDGDLDLAVGNQDGPNHLYLNLGKTLAQDAIWISNDRDFTWQVAWGDVDNDGDLDLAAGNAGFTSNNGVYQNLLRNPSTAAYQPFATLTRPGVTANGAFFSSAEVISATRLISISYQLFAANPQAALQIFPEFSPNGGGYWLPAKAGPGGDGVSNLHAAGWPTGTEHLFVWDAEHDLIKNDQISFRIRVQDELPHSPILWPATSGASPLFRFEAPWFVRVVDEAQQPIPGATVYVDGRTIGATNQAGLVSLRGQSWQAGMVATALATQFTQPSLRANHADNAAYTIYTTSLVRDPAGNPLPTPLTDQHEQRLTIHTDEPLVIFNLVISLNWNADITYTHMLGRAVYHASTYLYDLTDGQMAFGEVTIYPNQEHWLDADIQMYAQNQLRPHVRPRGLMAPEGNVAIQLGRAWDGHGSVTGKWDQPDGYRTIIHEFGHYALGLYDEYLKVRIGPNREIKDGEPTARCVDRADQNQNDQPIRGSAMYDQYNTSEFSDVDQPQLWSDDCKLTKQWKATAIYLNKAMSAWDTILYYYADTSHQPPRWQLRKPSQRQPNQVIEGPEQLAAGLPAWPTTTFTVTEQTGAARQLTILDDQGQPAAGAEVELVQADGHFVIPQGLTNRQGQIEIYGAAPGNKIRASVFNRALWGEMVVSDQGALVLHLQPRGLETSMGQE